MNVERADLVKAVAASFNTRTEGECDSRVLRRRFPPVMIRFLRMSATLLVGVRLKYGERHEAG